MRNLLTILAKCFAALPEAVLERLCAFLGSLFYRISQRRRRTLLSNLSHAFPEMDRARRQSIARMSCARMVEMGLLSFCSGQFSDARVRRSLTVDDTVRSFFETKASDKAPVVYLVPHFTLMEMQPWLKTVVPSEQAREIICIYRPLNQAPLEAHIKAAREKHGTQFNSRREGFVDCMKCLRRGGQVSILFDQNSRTSGALVLFMGRLCAATDLPGILAKKFQAEVRMLWVERTAFWRGSLKVETLPDTWAHAPEKLTTGAQFWLEQQFKQNPDIIPDWLWSHNRWNTESASKTLFSLQNDKVWLDTSAAVAGLTEIPRKTRILMHLPRKQNQVTSLIPILQKIRECRPDMAFWIMADEKSLEHPPVKALADRFLPIPAETPPEKFMSAIEDEYIDTICDWHPESPYASIWGLTGCNQILGWDLGPDQKTHYSDTFPKPLKTVDNDNFGSACLAFAANFGLEIDQDS